MLKTFPLVVLPSGAWGVDLPTYRMLPGKVGPVTAGVLHGDGVLPGIALATVAALNPYVSVEIPENTPLDAAGEIDAVALRKMYAEHPRFGAATWTPPKTVKPA